MHDRASVSIVCVANDERVRLDCLDRSIGAHLPEAPRTEYIPVDNRDGRFASAGAALNHGAARATGDVVVFVHQDVYLHSLAALERAAGVLMRRGDIGLHGAAGITASGRVLGRVRDRVVLIGEQQREPVDVDSLDEVLFMVTRRDILREPLASDPDLAWHAYAVEYGMRVRAAGRRVTAGAIPLTHNSMSVNLERLDVAHRAIAAQYPDALPITTTCGVVSSARPREPALRAHRWRYRWLRESLVAHRARRAVGGGPVVLSDMRYHIDAAIAGVDDTLEIVNLLADPNEHEAALREPVELTRSQQRVRVSAASPQRLRELLRSRPAGGPPMLLTNLSPVELGALAGVLPASDRLLGYHENIGCWALLGAPAAWRPTDAVLARRATPFGMPRSRAA